MATDLAAELFVPLLLAVIVLLLHVLDEVEDGVKQESTQTTQQAPLLLVFGLLPLPLIQAHVVGPDLGDILLTLHGSRS